MIKKNFDPEGNDEIFVVHEYDHKCCVLAKCQSNTLLYKKEV